MVFCFLGSGFDFPLALLVLLLLLAESSLFSKTDVSSKLVFVDASLAVDDNDRLPLFICTELSVFLGVKNWGLQLTVYIAAYIKLLALLNYSIMLLQA